MRKRNKTISIRCTDDEYKKTGGIQYYHFVQSHPKGYEISPDLAHKIAVEFAERGFKGFECVVATHTAPCLLIMRSNFPFQ